MKTEAIRRVAASDGAATRRPTAPAGATFPSQGKPAVAEADLVEARGLGIRWSAVRAANRSGWVGSPETMAWAPRSRAERRQRTWLRNLGPLDREPRVRRLTRDIRANPAFQYSLRGVRLPEGRVALY
jgi:hypothetical protein